MEAELLAIQRAVTIARHQEWKKIEVEGDCKVLLEALSDRDACPYWQLSSLFLNVIELASFFSRIKFLWIPIRGNAVAHGLALWARTIGDSGFPSFRELPNSVSNDLFFDY